MLKARKNWNVGDVFAVIAEKPRSLTIGTALCMCVEKNLEGTEWEWMGNPVDMTGDWVQRESQNAERMFEEK